MPPQGPGVGADMEHIGGALAPQAYLQVQAQEYLFLVSGRHDGKASRFEEAMS